MAWPPTTHQDVQDEITKVRGAWLVVAPPTGTAATDTANIQAAINTGTGRIALQGGTYVVTGGGITLSSNVTIRGSGWGTVLQVAAGTNGYALTLNPGTGWLTVDVADLTIDGNASTQTSGGCIDAGGSVQSRFDNIHFTSAYDVCLWVHSNPGGTYGHHNRITRCLFDGLNTVAGANQQGIRLQAADENYVAFCDFENWGGTNASPGPEPYAIKDWAGIQQIVSNVFVGGQEAIRIQDASSTRVIGNTFDGVGRSGIHASGSKNVIMGNLFSDGSSNSTGAWAQCEVDNSTSAVVVGNAFTVQTAGIVRNCFREYGTSSTKSLVADNVIDLQGSLFGGNPAVELHGAASKVTNTLGWNPVGASISQPALPASGTAYTNTLGGDCMVTVSGGTVSGISVGGTTTGLTSGSFRVPVGQSITVTYSAAPTWHWFGD